MNTHLSQDALGQNEVMTDNIPVEAVLEASPTNSIPLGQNEAPTVTTDDVPHSKLRMKERPSPLCKAKVQREDFTSKTLTDEQRQHCNKIKKITLFSRQAPAPNTQLLVCTWILSMVRRTVEAVVELRSEDVMRLTDGRYLSSCKSKTGFGRVRQRVRD